MKGKKNFKISIIGLGYVGLPLLVEFSKKYNASGFDLDSNRIYELKRKIDRTGEISKESLDLISVSSEVSSLEASKVFIVTVPTPVDNANIPNLTPLKSACSMIAKYLKKDSYVIFESTVFPGCTEDVCVPILEDISGLKLNKDFYCGYSPERINPGDKTNTLTKILKITSGSNKKAAKFIDDLYSSIIEAGTFVADSIKVAEAAKVIENTQRDINIALMNELSVIFNKMDIDTHAVLEAASTKWNFLKFIPGLVGGHCIGVDPYYLTYKAELLGYHPEVILSGRRINDSMPRIIAEDTVKLMTSHPIRLQNQNVLLLGATFKENCPDTRNSKVFDLVKELIGYGINIDWVDPIADFQKENIPLKIRKKVPNKTYDLIILAVPHKLFKKLDNAVEIEKITNSDSKIIDLKSFFSNITVSKTL